MAITVVRADVDTDADITSWASVTRASGFDTFATTPTSANLRALVTDESGSGALLFANGALGTPASGVLTNATGLPVATGISGLGSGWTTDLADTADNAGVGSYPADQIAVTDTVTPTARPDRTRWATRRAVAGRDFGMTVDGSTNQATIINAIAAALDERGGGILDLPHGSGANIAVSASIDNQYSNVLIRAPSQFSTWSDGGTSPAYGVTIIPTAAITVLKRRSPYNASNPRTIGGGFEGIRVIGNNTATRLLEVDSVIGAKLHLHLQDSVGSEAAKFISGVAGTNLADSCTIQLCDIKLIVRQDGQLSSGAGITSSRAADCVRWLGSSNANVSMNTGVMLDLVHYNGHGLVGDGDQNVFSFFRATRAGGTGLPIYGDGPTASIPVGFENNVFQHYSTNAAGYIEGTGDASVTAGVVNSIEFNDVGNASPRPTAGTASRWVIRDTSGRYTNLRAEGLAVGSATSEADSAGSGLTSSIAAYLYNGSNAHAYLATAGAVWRQYVDGSTGDLTFLQVTGTDDLLLPVRTKIAGEEINAWANWTPTISAGSGTLTTASGVAGSCRWSKVNNVVYFTVYIEVTTKGTGATSLRFTLPETAAITSVVYGYEGTGGALLVGLIASGSNVVNVYKTNGVDPLADATFYRVAGFYEAS